MFHRLPDERNEKRGAYRENFWPNRIVELEIVPLVKSYEVDTIVKLEGKCKRRFTPLKHEP